jgi:hypothetical protein
MKRMITSLMCLLLIVASTASAQETKQTPQQTVRVITIKGPDANLNLSHAAYPPARIPGQTPTADLLKAAQAKVPAIKNHEFKSPEEVLRVAIRDEDFNRSGMMGGNVPGMEPEKESWQEWSRGDIAVWIDLTTASQPPAVVEALADAVVEVMRERVMVSMAEVVKSQGEGVENWKTQIANHQRMLKEVQDKLVPLRSKMKKDTGRIDLSASGIRAAKDALEIERQTLDLDMAGLKARQEALNEAIADAGKRAKESEQTDPGVQVMRKLVDISVTNLSRVKQLRERQAASESELAKAEDEVALAQAKLAERIAGLGASAEALTHWRHALIDATIEQREKLARADAAMKRLAGLIDAEQESKPLEELTKRERSITEELAKMEANAKGSAEAYEMYKRTKPEFMVSKEPPKEGEFPAGMLGEAWLQPGAPAGPGRPGMRPGAGGRAAPGGLAPGVR